MSEGEFEFIAHRLRPLAAGTPGALELLDDAALLDPSPGMQLVLAKDAMVAGVHFLEDDPAGQIAQKLLRVNLSDLAAMGAAPIGYLLALARPKAIEDDWLGGFCAGFAADNGEFGIALLGGDTVSTPGPLTLSLTAIGEVPNGEALLRGGARASDDIWISGTLGDAALGLAVLRGALDVAGPASAHLIGRYRVPLPRLALGQALRGLAHAAIDISDGLVADLGHVVEASGVGAEVWADFLPLSEAARDLQGAREAALSGGDDYELLFTAPSRQRNAIEQLGAKFSLALTRIGHISAQPGLRVLDADGAEVAVVRSGWRHF
jgi:thiamine-monophosphate kinase